MKKLLLGISLSIIFTFLFNGCTNDPQVIEKESLQQKEEKIHIPAKKSLVYIVRPYSYVASAQQYKININGKDVEVIKTGTYFSYLVPSGNVNISAETEASILNFGLGLLMMEKPTLTLSTLPGKTYYINVEYTFSGGPKLTQVSPQEGKPLVQKAKKLKTGSDKTK